jgi:hypothetical protein
MRVEEYLARAEECEAMAKDFPNFGAKKLYENLADRWRELATQAIARERHRDDHLVAHSENSGGYQS